MQPPQKNHVIILGSTARAATASAIAAGLQVTAIDAFGDADLREMCQLYQPLSENALPLAFLRSQRPSTLIPLGGCERWIDSIASLGNHHRIAGATAEQWRSVNELSLLGEIARAAAIRFPPSHPFTDAHGRFRPIGGRALHGWLIKTPSTCGGLGVRRAEHASIAPGEFYQRWIRGISIGASYLATGNEVHLLGVCRGLRVRAASRPAIYAGSCGPLHLGPRWTPKLVHLGHAAAHRLQLRGLFNVDFILHPVRGLYLLEINPRYTASMELLEPTNRLLPGPSLLAAHLRCFEKPPAKRPRRPDPVLRLLPGQGVRCKRVVFAREKLLFDAETRRRLRAIVDAHAAQWADIPAEGTTILAQHPLLSIFTKADSAPAAIRKAGRIARALQAV